VPRGLAAPVPPADDVMLSAMVPSPDTGITSILPLNHDSDDGLDEARTFSSTKSLCQLNS
jgi:hypothetical protein